MQPVFVTLCLAALVMYAVGAWLALTPRFYLRVVQSESYALNASRRLVGIVRVGGLSGLLSGFLLSLLAVRTL